MSNTFDPYLKWLGIPPAEQPPNLYRLLGVQVFEKDEDAINNAADQRMGLLRTFQAGERGKESQKLLNEIAAARIVLSDPERRQEYDNELYRTQVTSQVAPAFGSGMTPDSPLPPAADPYEHQQSSEVAWTDEGKGVSTAATSKSKFLIYLCVFVLGGWLILFFVASGLFYAFNRSSGSVAKTADGETEKIDIDSGLKNPDVSNHERTGETDPHSSTSNQEKDGTEGTGTSGESDVNESNGNGSNESNGNGSNESNGNGSNGNGSNESNGNGSNETNETKETKETNAKPEMKDPDSGTPTDPESGTTEKPVSYAHLLEPVPDDRISVPSVDEMEAFNVEIDEKYPFTKTSSSLEKDKLLKQLEEQAESETDQGLRYALLLKSMYLNARQSSTQASRVREKISSDYQVDRDELRVQLLLALSKRVQSSTRKQFIDLAFNASREMMDHGRWELAKQVIEIVEPQLKSASVAKVVQLDFRSQRHRLLLLHPHWRAFRDSLKKIELGNVDAKNLRRVGLWFCSSNQSPENGLKLLAASRIESETWQKLIALEGQTSSDAATQVRTIADAYYAALPAGNDQEKLAFSNRAMHWYQIASKLDVEQGTDRGYVLSRIQSLKSEEWRTSEKPQVGLVQTVLRPTGLQIPNQAELKLKRIQFVPRTTKILTADENNLLVTELLGEKNEVEIDAGAVISYLPRTATINAAGNRIACFVTGQRQGHANLMLWNCDTGGFEDRMTQDFPIPDEDSDVEFLVTWSPDGRILTAFGGEGLMHIDPITMKLQRKDARHHARVCIRYNDLGNVLAFPSSRRGWVTAINFKGAVVKLDGDRNIRCLEFSADGSMLFAGSQDGTVIAWDTAKGKERKRLSVIDDEISDDTLADILLIPNTSYMVSAAGRNLTVWNLKSDFQVQSLELDYTAVELDVTSDGRIFCVLDSSGVTRFYTVHVN